MTTDVPADGAALLRLLHENRHRIVVEDPDPVARRRWRRVLFEAKERQVPDGWHLRYTGRDRGDLIIELAEGPHPDGKYRGKRPEPIPLCPDPHVAALAAIGDSGYTATNQDRVLQMLSTLAVEAEHRGWAVTGARGGISVLADGCDPLQVTVREDAVVEERLPTPEELGDGHYEWERVRPSAHERGTRLVVAIQSEHDFHCSGRRRNWGDTSRWHVEEKLAEILDEVQARIQLARERAASELRETEARNEAWLAAMEAAEIAFDADRRARHLLQQAAAWRESVAVTAYCDAVEAHAAAALAADAEAMREWAAWGRAWAAQNDPLSGIPGPPTEDKPAPHELKPYLGGWSAYDPERG